MLHLLLLLCKCFISLKFLDPHYSVCLVSLSNRELFLFYMQNLPIFLTGEMHSGKHFGRDVEMEFETEK